MSQSLRFILLGAGSIGQRHLKNIQELGHSLVSVFDPDPARLAEVKQRAPNALLTTSEEEALTLPADAAFICSPTAQHMPQARAAIGRGLHAFIEKPLSHTLEETEALSAQAASQRRTVLVGCNMRFLPSLRRVWSLLRNGAIGRPLSVRVHWGYYLPHWKRHK